MAETNRMPRGPLVASFGEIIYTDREEGYIRGIKTPKGLDDRFMKIDAGDFPKKIASADSSSDDSSYGSGNAIHIFEGTIPIFASGEIDYKHEPVAVIFGPDYETVSMACKETIVDYLSSDELQTKREREKEDETPDLGIDTSPEPMQSGWPINDRGKQNLPDKAIAITTVYEEKAIENESSTYITCKIWKERDTYHIDVPTAWPNLIVSSVRDVLGISEDKIVIEHSSSSKRRDGSDSEADDAWLGSRRDEYILQPALLSVITAYAVRKSGGLCMALRTKLYNCSAHVRIERETLFDEDMKMFKETAKVTADLGAFLVFPKEFQRQVIAGSIPYYPISNFRVTVNVLGAKESHAYPFISFGAMGYDTAIAATEYHHNEILRQLEMYPGAWREVIVKNSGTGASMEATKNISASTGSADSDDKEETEGAKPIDRSEWDRYVELDDDEIEDDDRISGMSDPKPKVAKKRRFTTYVPSFSLYPLRAVTRMALHKSDFETKWICDHNACHDPFFLPYREGIGLSSGVAIGGFSANFREKSDYRPDLSMVSENSIVISFGCPIRSEEAAIYEDILKSRFEATRYYGSSESGLTVQVLECEPKVESGPAMLESALCTFVNQTQTMGERLFNLYNSYKAEDDLKRRHGGRGFGETKSIYYPIKIVKPVSRGIEMTYPTEFETDGFLSIAVEVRINNISLTADVKEVWAVLKGGLRKDMGTIKTRMRRDIVNALEDAGANISASVETPTKINIEVVPDTMNSYPTVDSALTGLTKASFLSAVKQAVPDIEASLPITAEAIAKAYAYNEKDSRHRNLRKAQAESAKAPEAAPEEEKEEPKESAPKEEEKKE